MYVLCSFICHGLRTSSTFSDVQAGPAVAVFYRSAQHSHNIRRVPTQLHHLDGHASMCRCLLHRYGHTRQGVAMQCAHPQGSCASDSQTYQSSCTDTSTVPISFCCLVQVATAEGLCTLDQVCPCNHSQLMLSCVGSHSPMMHTQLMVCKVYSGSTLTVYTYSNRVQ